MRLLPQPRPRQDRKDAGAHEAPRRQEPQGPVPRLLYQAGPAGLWRHPEGGRSIYFEAKHTDDERIEQRRLTQEQQDDLEAHHKLGAIAFVLVSVSLTDFYRVPWPVWRDMAEIYGRKYMTHAELSRYEVPATAGFIKFLHGIESETLGKEDAHDPTP